MDSDQHLQIYEVHQGMKGLMYLIDEHTELSVVKPEYLYFLMHFMVQQLEQLLYADGDYKPNTL